MSFWGELRRRNVVKVGIAYLVVAWLLAQIVDIVLPTFDAPAWVSQTIIFLLILGLPIVLIVAWAFEITPDGIKPTRSVAKSESITAVTGQKLNYIVTTLLAVAVVLLVIDNYVLDDGDAESSPGDAASAAPPVTDSASPAPIAESRNVLPNSVAVLPLDNLSADPDNAYFAAGMHEEILNQLAKLRNLNVISRTTMLRYQQTELSIPEIAGELNVEAIMEGSVRFDGDNVLVTAQLIDAGTDSHLWSERYERELSGIFAIQADIAMNVANALNAEFTPEEQRRIERAPTSSPAAYGLYLQLANLIATGQGQAAHEMLDRVIAIDPDFALAYGRKASMYATGLVNSTASSAQSWANLEPLVREYAGRALELDPENPAALSALGHLANFSWRWTEAREAYERVLASWLGDLEGGIGGPGGWLIAWSGDPRRATALAERYVNVNPLDWAVHWFYGTLLQYAGDYDAAAASFENGISLVPILPLQHSWLAISEIARGDFAAARQQLQLSEQLLGASRGIINLLDIAYGYGRVGDRAEAQRLFDEISMLAQDQDIGAGGWALAHLAVGNVDEALEQLERGAAKAARHEPDAGYYTLMNIRMNFAADPLLEQPEFVNVRDRLRGD